VRLESAVWANYSCPYDSLLASSFTLQGVYKASVRNNLFHGGKSGDKDHDRNDELIKDAIQVIIEAVESNEDLKACFEGLY